MSFEKHIAKYTSYKEVDIIDFRRPKNNCYNILFILHKERGIMFISGDYGSCVFVWFRKLSFKSFKGFNIDNFDSKCYASENGRDFKVFDKDALIEFYKNYILESETISHDFDEDKFKEIIKLIDIDDVTNKYIYYDWIQEYYPIFNGISEFKSFKDYYDWIDKNFLDFNNIKIGEDYICEDLYSAGEAYNPRLNIIIKGLKKAISQLEEKGLI